MVHDLQLTSLNLLWELNLLFDTETGVVFSSEANLDECKDLGEFDSEKTHVLNFVNQQDHPS